MTGVQQPDLCELLQRLVRDGCVFEREFEMVGIDPGALGFEVRDDKVVLAPDVTTLDVDRIRAALSPAAAAWLRELKVHRVVDSTNTRMAAAAQAGSVDGKCWFAELQTAGRGRRGRHWLSPFARNLTLSMGFALGGTPRDAGALSLAVGLAVADLIERLGVENVALKWPNDVLIGGAKACGILIELAAHRRPLECVIGIGLNLHIPRQLRDEIGQQVADLRQQGVSASRNALAAALVSNVQSYVHEFRDAGFRGMRPVYDAVHVCHGERCRVVQGNGSYEGIVLGVTDAGELRIEGPEGEQRFNGGEVSLRRRA